MWIFEKFIEEIKMESLTSYNRAIEQLNAATQKEVGKFYGEAKEHYEIAIEYFIEALHRKPLNVLLCFQA